MVGLVGLLSENSGSVGGNCTIMRILLCIVVVREHLSCFETKTSSVVACNCNCVYVFVSVLLRFLIYASCVMGSA